ncbi:hypothetical protein [Parasediminibacterium sp. JCM 36343]|uniref:hypothetical protein n=1 Tax=Parasediminibacterium sp. JCM 36343 TaxID=3374279 RepID=UPI00397C87A6
MNFLDYLDSIAPFSVLVYLIFRKSKMEGAFLWFIFFIVALLFFNVTANLLVKVQFYFKKERNNLIVYHIACIAYFLLLLKFFSFLLRSVYSRIVDGLFIVLFFIAVAFDFSNWIKTPTFNSDTFGLASLWVIIKCLSYYAQKLIGPAYEDILKNRMFWIISGLFLYFSVSFFIFISYSLLSNSYNPNYNAPISYLWYLQNIILALSCSFFIKAIRCKP